jgi:glycosyltransferase involved in cell wall biosynthesis
MSRLGASIGVGGDGRPHVDLVAPLVLRVIARLNVGGPAIHTVLLTEGLERRGFRSLLVTGVVSRDEGDMAPWAKRRGVHPLILHELTANPTLLGDVRAFVKLCRLVFEARPAIIHTHTAKAGVLGRLAGLLYNGHARLTGRRRAVVLHTFHGHLFHGYFGPRMSGMLVRIERALARLADRVIAVSQQVRDDLAHVYRVCDGAKISVVPLGLDLGWVDELAAHRGRLRRAVHAPPEAILVGIVGRLTAVKNHEVFLEAAVRVRSPALRFLVIGDGGRRRWLADLAERLALDGRVTFTGWQDDPATIYADLAVVCLTSRNEGTPVALIEAMAAGLPIVATRVGGIADLMTGPPVRDVRGFERYENGLLVPPDRPDVLATALDCLAGDREMRGAMGAAGRTAVLARYSSERLLDDVESLYRQLLASVKG